MKQEKRSLKISKNLPLIIGSFDILHKGHKKLFDKVKSNKFNVILISDSINKKEWINSLMMRYLWIYRLHPKKIFTFDAKKNNISAIDFIKVILKSISPSVIIVGSDFRFGKNNTGDVKLLKKYFKVSPIKYDSKYQTSKIKNLYKKGKISEANKLLYRPIVIYGKVINCKHKGIKLGFPTLNVMLENDRFKFKTGSYATLCSLANNKNYYGATCIYNINGKQMIETHILNNFPKSYKSYKKDILIVLLKYVMPFKKISNKENLIKYIDFTVKTIKKYFKIKP